MPAWSLPHQLVASQTIGSTHGFLQSAQRSQPRLETGQLGLETDRGPFGSLAIFVDAGQQHVKELAVALHARTGHALQSPLGDELVQFLLAGHGDQLQRVEPSRQFRQRPRAIRSVGQAPVQRHAGAGCWLWRCLRWRCRGRRGCGGRCGGGKGQGGRRCCHGGRRRSSGDRPCCSGGWRCLWSGRAGWRCRWRGRRRSSWHPGRRSLGLRDGRRRQPRNPRLAGVAHIAPAGPSAAGRRLAKPHTGRTPWAGYLLGRPRAAASC